MSFTARTRSLSDSIFWGPSSSALDQAAAEESRQRHFPSDEELVHRVAAQDPGAHPPWRG